MSSAHEPQKQLPLLLDASTSAAAKLSLFLSGKLTASYNDLFTSVQTLEQLCDSVAEAFEERSGARPDLRPSGFTKPRKS